MLSMIAGRLVRAAAPWVVLVTLLVLRATPAHADNVSSLIDQLNNDDSEKVRLSAALNLAKLGDQKAILPMAKALLNDSDKNVRSACAVGLGKLVTSSTKATIKGLAISNLKTASTNDSSDFVKQQADKALVTITGQGGGGGSNNGGGGTGASNGGIYVNIGPMSSKTGGNDKKLQALIVSTAEKTMGRVAAKMATSWPGGAPSKTALAQKNVSGFYVDGTLNKIEVKGSGGSSTVTCKVSMLLASFPDKSVFGFLNGGASVSAGGSASDQALAGEDCVQAVIEDLIAKKIVPTICMKATCP